MLTGLVATTTLVRVGGPLTYRRAPGLLHSGVQCNPLAAIALREVFVGGPYGANKKGGRGQGSRVLANLPTSALHRFFLQER